MGGIIRDSPNLLRLEITFWTAEDRLERILKGGAPSLKELLILQVSADDPIDLRSACPALQSICLVKQSIQVPVLLTGTALKRVVINLDNHTIGGDRRLDCLGDPLCLARVPEFYIGGCQAWDIESLAAITSARTCIWHIAYVLKDRNHTEAEEAMAVAEGVERLRTVSRSTSLVEDRGKYEWILEENGLVESLRVEAAQVFLGCCYFY